MLCPGGAELWNVSDYGKSTGEPLPVLSDNDNRTGISFRLGDLYSPIPVTSLPRMLDFDLAEVWIFGREIHCGKTDRTYTRCTSFPLRVVSGGANQDLSFRSVHRCPLVDTGSINGLTTCVFLCDCRNLDCYNVNILFGDGLLIQGREQAHLNEIEIDYVV